MKLPRRLLEEVNMAFVESSRGTTYVPSKPLILTSKDVLSPTYTLREPQRVSFQPPPTHTLGVAPLSSKGSDPWSEQIPNHLLVL